MSAFEVLEIRVFLCLRFTGFESRRTERFQKFVTFGVRKCWKFVLFVDFWMSSLPGVRNCNGGAEFHSLLLLERCEIHGEYT